MKKANFVFSGFLASLLLGMGNVNAADATIKIASKTYVDTKETSILDSVNKELATKADASALTELAGLVDTNTEGISSINTKIGTDDFETSAKNIVGAINELKGKTDGLATEGNFTEMNNKISAVETKVTEAVASISGKAEKTYVDEQLATKASSTDFDALKETIVNAENGLAIRVDAATAGLAGKESISNRVQTIDSSSTDDQYPTAKAVYDAIAGEGNLVEPVVDNSVKIVQEQVDSQAADIAELEGEVVGLASDVETFGTALTTAEGKITAAEGKITAAEGKITTAEGKISEVEGKITTIEENVGNKLDKKLVGEAEGNILTVGAGGAITSSATIAQGKVSGLTTTLAGKANASDLTALETEVGNKLDKNLGTGKSGQILTVGSDGAITSSATIAQGKVDGLTAELDGKADKATTLAGYGITDGATKTELNAKADASALTTLETEVDGKQDKLTATQMNAVDSGITKELVTEYNGYGERITNAENSIGTLTEDVGSKASTEELNTLKDTVATLNNTIGNDSSGLVNKVTSTEADLAKKENLSNKTSEIRTIKNGADNIRYPTELAVRTLLDTKANKETTLAGYGITDAYTKSETNSKITEVFQDVAGGDFSAAFEGKEDTKNKINEITETNKTSTDAYPSAKAVVTYALPQPTEACLAASGMCVLSVNNKTGAIEWVSVSSPAYEN